MKTKRFLVAALTLCMLLCILPILGTPALASDTPASDTKTGAMFTDVTAKDWFFKNVNFVCAAGLMNGTGGNKFSPHSTMTRGMMVTVLYRLSGDKGTYKSSFSDVASSAWYKNAVGWAATNGISNGIGKNLFAPNSEVTREQLAILFYNYAKYKKYDVTLDMESNLLSYNDAFTMFNEYNGKALRYVICEGIMTGDDKGNMNVKATASRAEVATMLRRFIENAAN